MTINCGDLPESISELKREILSIKEEASKLQRQVGVDLQNHERELMSCRSEFSTKLNLVQSNLQMQREKIESVILDLEETNNSSGVARTP